jgi:phosphoglycolate phosphatase
VRGGTLLVFDLDNTLVHSRIDFQGIRTEIIRALHGAGASDAAEAELRRLAIPELILLAEAHDERASAAVESLSRHATTDLRPRTSLAAGCWEIVLRHEHMGMQEASVEPDADATLLELRRRGYALAVLTNNARPACEAVLRRFELRDHFEVIITRDDVEHLKPQPDGVVLARERAGGMAERVVVIGDSWIDGLAAHRGGAAFVVFRGDVEGMRARGADPTHRVARLADLLELFP